MGNGWQTALNDVTVGDLQRWAAFCRSIAWQTLVPDQIHVVGTAGYGTPNVGGSFESDNYIPVAASADGTLAVAYFSGALSATLTINLVKFADAVTARWFDPTNANYTAIAGSPFANSGTHNFRPPGKNDAGDPDWVLLLSAGPTK